MFGWVWGRYWGVYIVLLKIGLVYLDLNFLILLILVPLILVPLCTIPKISSTHLMQFFNLIPMV